jgi:hypothetical protein
LSHFSATWDELELLERAKLPPSLPVRNWPFVQPVSPVASVTRSETPPQSKTPSPAISYQRVEPVAIDERGKSYVPIWFKGSGVGTLHFYPTYFSVDAAATSDSETRLRIETEFWSRFEKEESINKSNLRKFSLSPVPELPGRAQIFLLGDSISQKMNLIK